MVRNALLVPRHPTIFFPPLVAPSRGGIGGGGRNWAGESCETTSHDGAKKKQKKYLKTRTRSGVVRIKMVSALTVAMCTASALTTIALPEAGARYGRVLRVPFFRDTQVVCVDVLSASRVHVALSGVINYEGACDVVTTRVAPYDIELSIVAYPHALRRALQPLDLRIERITYDGRHDTAVVTLRSRLYLWNRPRHIALPRLPEVSLIAPLPLLPELHPDRRGGADTRALPLL